MKRQTRAELEHWESEAKAGYWVVGFLFVMWMLTFAFGVYSVEQKKQDLTHCQADLNSPKENVTYIKKVCERKYFPVNETCIDGYCTIPLTNFVFYEKCEGVQNE